MKILVCVKQVPDPQTHLGLDEQGRLIRPEQPRWQMNRYDEFAVEEAVALKKARPGVTVDVVSLGPARTAAVLERALGMGCDNGAQILLDEGQEPGALETATWLAAFAAGRGHDLILCGVMSEDAMQAQVGPMLAQLMGLPVATAVVALAVSPDGKTVATQREGEGGARLGLAMDLPAVVCVQSGINKPRYPTLSNLLRAKGQKHETIQALELADPSAALAQVGLGEPQRSRQGLTLRGDTAAKASQLADILREKALI